VFSDSAALIAYLDEDPDDMDLAYKLITAAYMVYMGYCSEDEFYVDEATYYLNDCQELHYERSTDIDFG